MSTRLLCFLQSLFKGNNSGLETVLLSEMLCALSGTYVNEDLQDYS